jgi:threonine/homoserine/homoserine lactone efflux protein
MSVDTWLAFATASFVMLAIPGPTILLVVSYALSHGRSVATAVVIGVALGDLTAMTASMLGLGALLATSATLFTALKWIGAAYLAWLGFRLWRAPVPDAAPDTLDDETSPHDAERDTRGLARIAFHAFAVTALNPKSIVFFVAFVPQFIAPGVDPAPQLALMTATFVLLAAANAAAYGLLAERLRRLLKTPRAARTANRIGGGALIGLGVATALARRAA